MRMELSMNTAFNRTFGVAAVAALCMCGAVAAESIVHIDEMDHYANRVALFNPGGGFGEAHHGILMLCYSTTNHLDAHKEYFRISKAPKEKEWAVYFKFRLDNLSADREFGLKLYFGDPEKPEVRLLTVREEGSFFDNGPKPPAPKIGDAGFVHGWGEASWGAWNYGAITVADGKATFHVVRGGCRVAECSGTFPADKRLVGWNLAATGAKTDVKFDRLIVADGTVRPYERGDLQEVLDNIAEEPVGKWDAAFGAPMENGNEVAADLSKNAFTAIFRAPFQKRAKDVAGVGCAFEFTAGTNKPYRISFGAGDREGTAKYRIFGEKGFANAEVKAVATNSVLTVTGSRLGMCTVPPFGRWQCYETPEINEIVAAIGKFPKPAARVYTLKVAPEADAAGTWVATLNGQFLSKFAFDAPVSSVMFVGDEGAEARCKFDAIKPVEGPAIWTLPVREGGFKLERVRENLSTFMLECNHYLSRDAFEGMPSSCLFNVPRRQWAKAVALCKIDPTAPKEFVPVITARLTQFHDNGGRSLAMCQETIDLSKPDPRVVKKGDLYEVTFDFDIASIMDLTSMVDGLSRRELPYLHFEFTGPLWEKNRYYIDHGKMPAEEIRSNVVVLEGKLVESPVWFRVTPERPYSLYYPGETPKVNVEARPVTKGNYTLSVEVAKAGEGSDDVFVSKQDYSFNSAFSKTLELPVTAGLGLYRVSYALRAKNDPDRLLQWYDTTYGLLAKNTREAVYDSPYYSWNFRGAHGTAPRFEDWSPAYDYLGVKRTLLDLNPKAGMWETNATMKAHGFTHAEFPYIGVPSDSEADRKKAMDKMREYVTAFPHCKQALVFHESGGGPFPKELYGEKTELNEAALKHQENRVANATRTIKCWHEVDPSVKMIVGNSGESYGLIAELMRGGLDKSLVDSWGEESVGLTMPPEMTTALTPWLIKKLARIYGYPETMDCPWEWKCRTERYERSFRGAAAVNLRDALIAHALGYKTIPVGCGTETANSYADTIWCSGTFSRWPMAYPRENALAVANMTLVLDRAKFLRQVETGSLTVYALEFKAKDGKWIYAIWDSRGETTAMINWKDGAKKYELVSLLGAREISSAKDVAISDEPCYIISSEQIASFTAAMSRTFKNERRADFARLERGEPQRTVVEAFDSADGIDLCFDEEVRIDPKFDSAPFRPGKFAAKTVTDEERGACIELEHLSQEDCPEIMQEYVFLKLKEPKTIEKSFNTLGIWAKGNSNWGKVSFELTDAEGEKWYTSGIGGVGCYVYDWPAKLAFNYDGWNFLQVPVTDKSDVVIMGPGMNEWLWTRDGSGDGRINWPVKVSAIGVSQYGRTLDLLEMKKGSPTLRLGAIEVR